MSFHTQKHIEFAHKLMKEQFSFIGGLFSTLLQERCYNLHDNSIQISFLNMHHLTADSNVGYNKNSVNIYDFLFPDADFNYLYLNKEYV